MLELGQIVLLAAHLIAMNIASAAPLLCLVLVRYSRQRQDDVLSLKAATQLAGGSCLLLIAGVVLGVLVGALRWMAGDTALIDVIPFFGRKVFWGVLELACSLLWMLGYWYWLRRGGPSSVFLRFVHGGLAVLAATNLLYHFPPLLTIMSMAARGSIQVTETVDAASFRQWMYTPNVLAHTLHFTIASVAITCGYLFWIVDGAESNERQLGLGGRVALGATVLQIPSGLWLLVVTPVDLQAKLMGNHPIATGCFLMSILCTFALLQQLSSLAMGQPNRQVARRASGLMVLTVVLMTGALHVLRS